MMVGYADETVVGGETVGGRLRSAREAHGLSLDDIAARTRVPTRHLKAIEEDAFDQLPAAPYSVGFAKAFADAVGLNREEIGREFRAEKEGYGAADAGFTYVSEEPRTAGSGGVIKVAAILVLIVAVAVGLWMSGIFGGSNKVATPPAAPATPAGQAALPPVAPEAQPPIAPTEETGGPSEENSSGTTQGDRQTTETGTSSRRSGASSEERDASQSSTNQSEPAAPATQDPPPKTTRQLNEEAAARAAATAAPAPAAPPVVAPPPPEVTPAAPAATP